MKKSNYFKRLSYVMSIMLVLMLVSPVGLGVYAADDPAQPVAAETTSADTSEAGVSGTETAAQKADESAEETETAAEPDGDLKEKEAETEASQEQATEAAAEEPEATAEEEDAKAPDDDKNAEEAAETREKQLLGEPEDQNEEGVARIGDEHYATLAAAVSAAQAGETIVMIGDEELTGPVSILKNLTIDLNGHEISAGFGGGAIVIPREGAATVNITDTSDAGNGVISNTAGNAVEAQANTTLNVKGGKLYGSRAGIDAPSTYATINVQGGTVEGGQFGIEVTGGDVNITGGKIHGTYEGILGGLGTPSPKIKVSGGSISSSENAAGYRGIYLRGGEVEVTGGTISGGTGIFVSSFSWGASSQISAATISGGTVKGAVSSVAIEDRDGLTSKFNIEGGRFSDVKGNGDAFSRPEGQILMDDDNDGLYELATPVAKRVVGGEDVIYGTLQGAFDAAESGDTVYVIADITLTEKAAIRGKAITLHLGDHTITNDESYDTSSFGTGLIDVAHGEGIDAGLTLTGGESGKLVSTNGLAVWLESGTRPRDGYSNFTMDTVTIEAKTSAVFANGNHSNITIDSGTIHSVKNGPAGDSQGAIKNAVNGIVTINGGTITSDEGTALSISTSTAIVNGGTLTGGTYGINMTGTASGRVTVADGVITGGDASINAAAPGKFTINGGVYSDGAGNAEGYVRKDDKMLVKGANSEYPDMFALGDAVASIERDGKTNCYATLADAAADAKAGETIVMIGDEELTGPVSILKNLTIDLNGHEISANFGGGAIVIPWGEGATTRKEVTITDTSDAGSGAIRNETGNAVEPQAYATLNVKGGELYGNRTGINAPSSYATINVQGGTVEGGQFGIEATGGNVNITDGTIYGTYGGVLGGLGSPAPNIKVSGGSISSSENAAGYRGIYLRGGELEVTGGTISGGTGILVASFSWGSSSQTSSATISGGTVIGADSSVSIEDRDGLTSAFNINGGRYSDEIGNRDDYTRPPHQHLQKDGDYYVLKTDPRTEVTVEIGEGHEAVAEGWAEYLNGNIEDIDLDIDEASADGTAVTLYCYDKSKTVGELQHELAELLNDYMGSADMPGPRAGEHNKELISGLGALGQKPFDQYSDFDDISEEIEASADAIPDEQTYYALWEKPVTSIKITVETQLCGTEVTAASSSDREGQDPKPVTAIDAEGAHVNEAYWAGSRSGLRDDVFSGTLTAGEGAIVRIMVARDFGYYLNTEYLETFTVNGKEVAFRDIVGSSVGMRDFYADVDVAHDPGDPVREDLVEPTASEPGSYDEVVYCKGCDTELSRETIVIPAVTYEVTEGDGSVWTRGSGEELNFTFERSYKDEETFERHEEIRVDGETVDAADYEAEAGSLKVALKADYLEGLAEGDHTITAVFNDGEADAGFTIVEADNTPAGDDEDGTPGDDEDGTAGDDGSAAAQDPDSGNAQDPNTGDESNVALCLLLMFAAASAMLFARRRRS